MGILDDVLSSVAGQGRQPSFGAGSGGNIAATLIPILMTIMANKAGSGGMGGLGGSLSGQTGASGGGLGGLLGGLLGGGTSGSTGPASSVPGGIGGLGGMLGGGALAGALGQLVSSFQQNGHGAAAESWVGNGDNVPIAPHQVTDALGPDTMDQLVQHTGMPQNDIASQLSRMLPQLVNRLTPNGRLPTSDEASSWS